MPKPQYNDKDSLLYLAILIFSQENIIVNIWNLRGISMEWLSIVNLVFLFKLCHDNKSKQVEAGLNFLFCTKIHIGLWFETR